MGINITKIQNLLCQTILGGWLIYDFRGSNSIAAELLELRPEALLTRRFFYWIPRKGTPLKFVSAIEQNLLPEVEGVEITYTSWHELQKLLIGNIPQDSPIAIEYSPQGALPYISKIDAGTFEMLQQLGFKLASSADLLQSLLQLTQKQIESHREAANHLDIIANAAWDYIEGQLTEAGHLNEFQVQQFMLREFEHRGLATDHPPICSVNGNAANPHYQPTANSHASIKNGDFILIDLWCKKNEPNAIYADIARAAVLRPHPSQLEQQVFNVITSAQNAAIELLQERYARRQPIHGFEVDDLCRKIIQEAGFGGFFIHRTGHNISTQVHGPGAHLDNYETHDARELIPGSCFSLEPGIYLPGQFGMRLEFDVLITLEGKIEITGGRQDKLVCLTSY